MATAAELALLLKTQGADKVEKDLHGVGKAGEGMGNLLKVGMGAAVVGIGALVAGLASSVKAAMDAEVITAQLHAVIKSTGGAAGLAAEEVQSMALALSKVTMFEDDAIVSGQNLLLTFTNIGKDVFPLATEAMLNMSQALGQDLKASAIQLGKALNDPIAGVTALRKVGVSLTEAQEALIKKFVQSGDIMGAQKIILKELETEFGGAAKAAGQTLTGQLTILGNAFGNIQESIGEKVLPLLTPLIKNFADSLPGAIDATTAAIGALLSGQGFDIARQKLVEAFGDDNARHIATITESLFDLKEMLVPQLSTALGIVEIDFGKFVANLLGEIAKIPAQFAYMKVLVIGDLAQIGIKLEEIAAIATGQFGLIAGLKTRWQDLEDAQNRALTKVWNVANESRTAAAVDAAERDAGGSTAWGGTQSLLPGNKKYIPVSGEGSEAGWEARQAAADQLFLDAMKKAADEAEAAAQRQADAVTKMNEESARASVKAWTDSLASMVAASVNTAKQLFAAQQATQLADWKASGVWAGDKTGAMRSMEQEQARWGHLRQTFWHGGQGGPGARRKLEEMAMGDSPYAAKAGAYLRRVNADRAGKTQEATLLEQILAILSAGGLGVNINNMDNVVKRTSTQQQSLGSMLSRVGV